MRHSHILRYFILGLFMFSFFPPAEGKSPKATVTRIKGGTSMETAVPLGLSQDYKLSHHQRKGDFDYFYIDLNSNTLVTLDIRTLQKGLSLNEGRRTVTTQPYVHMELRDANQKLLQLVDIAGTPNSSQSATYRNRSPVMARYYVLVGSPEGDMHRDQVIFRVMVGPYVYGDLGTGQDAGADRMSAFPILSGTRYPSNSLGGVDFADVYTFPAQHKEWYTVAVRGEDPMNIPFKVTVRSPQKRSIVSYSSESSNQVMTKSFEILKDGTYSIEVSLPGPLTEKSLYSLELMKVEGKK